MMSMIVSANPQITHQTRNDSVSDRTLIIGDSVLKGKHTDGLNERVDNTDNSWSSNQRCV